MLISVVDVKLSVRIMEFPPECFDFLLIRGTYRLELNFDLSVKLFLVPLDLCGFQVLVPSLKDFTHLSDPVLFLLVFNNSLAMLLELVMFLEGQVAPHRHGSHSGYGHSFA